MSHFGLDKFWKPKGDEKLSIRILDEPLMSMGKREGWYWDHGVLMHDIGDKPKLCTLGGPYDENIQPVKRTFLPVIHEGEQKLLSLSGAAGKKIGEFIRMHLEQIRLSEESAELIEWQRAAARRFKRSKLFYGAKR